MISSKTIENIVVQTIEQKYLYYISEIDIYGLLRSKMEPFPQIPPGGIVEEFICSLKTKFPFNKIVVFLLEIYILSDWSE